MTIDAMFSLLGQIIAPGGIGALVAYGLFQVFGKGWIETQLAKDLEAAKSELSLLASRKLKLHDREYIVFPEVWAKLNKAYASLGAMIAPLRQGPSFNLMSDAQFQSWMQRSDLSDSEKEYLVEESDKNKAYVRILDFRLLRASEADYFDFLTYLQANRIFLSPEIKENLDHIASVLRGSWSKIMVNLEFNEPIDGKSFLYQAYEQYETEAKPIMDKVEALVQRRIFPESTVEQRGIAL